MLSLIHKNSGLPESLLCWYKICTRLCIGGCSYNSFNLSFKEFYKYKPNQPMIEFATMNNNSYFIVTVTHTSIDGITFNRENITRKIEEAKYVLVADSLSDFLQMVVINIQTSFHELPPYKIIEEELIPKMDYLTNHLILMGLDEIEEIQLCFPVERLFNEIEICKEYQEQCHSLKARWKTKNDTLNKTAFESVFQNLKAMDTDTLNQLLLKKFDLRFILKTEEEMTSEDLEFYVPTFNLSQEEIRAIYYRLSPWMKEKYLEKLEQKIDDFSFQTSKPIQPRKKVIITPSKTWNFDLCFSELFQKRRRRE